MGTKTERSWSFHIRVPWSAAHTRVRDVGIVISILGAHTRVRDVGIVSHRGLWGSQGAATLTSSDAFSCSAVERVAMHDGPR